MPRLTRSLNCRLSVSSANASYPISPAVSQAPDGSHGVGTSGPAVSGRLLTMPTTSFSRTLSARAALSGTKPSSATARCTRSFVSGRGLRRPFSTRDTEAIETPAARATS